MLFSTFESWYVYEHVEHYGFPSEWIGVTFSRTTFFNGLLAIFAGVLSNFFAETLGYGPVAPFALAVIPLGKSTANNLHPFNTFGIALFANFRTLKYLFRILI